MSGRFHRIIEDNHRKYGKICESQITFEARQSLHLDFKGPCSVLGQMSFHSLLLPRFGRYMGERETFYVIALVFAVKAY